MAIKGKFEILEHTGDLKIRIWGKDKKELFLNALLGMESGLHPELKTLNSELKTIKIQSIDLNALLVDFLGEALYLIQTNKEIYNEIKFKKFSGTILEVELSGQKVERFGEDIKAVTHHGLDVRQREDGLFEAIVLFDI
ncbi:MAG: archease [Candidatus Nealsonbacteria bacterium]|nr:archease [Candidatus Nealsonbacteria bacterium]